MTKAELDQALASADTVVIPVERMLDSSGIKLPFFEEVQQRVIVMGHSIKNRAELEGLKGTAGFFYTDDPDPQPEK